MIIEHVTLYENTAVVEELEVEEIELRALSVDPRLVHLSGQTRACIDRLFDGDVDEAAYTAARIANTHRYLPAWVLELNGAQRQGWKQWGAGGVK